MIDSSDRDGFRRLPMNGLELLSAELRARSLSMREPILTYSDALAAMHKLIAAGCAILCWEGLIRHPDGHFHHDIGGGLKGTEPILPRVREPWETYMQRSAEFCRRTMKLEHDEWLRDASHEQDLYFGLTAVAKQEKGG